MTDARAERQGDEAAAVRAEAASAGLVLQLLVKAARGFVMYLPNNPLHDKFFEDLRSCLDRHIEEYGSLWLIVEHDAFRLGEEVVYTTPELRENLAFRIYADGIRALSLEEGLEPEELRTLVEIVAKPSGEDEEDDVVTRLWAAELPHVSYVLADLPPAAGPEALGAPPPATVQEAAIRGVAAAVKDLPGPPPALLSTATILAITEEEIAALQERVTADMARTPFDDVATILEAVLAGETDEEIFAEVASLAGRLAGDLLLTGEAELARGLVFLLGRVAALPDLAPERRAAVEAGRAGVVREESVPQLARALADGGGVSRDTLHAIVTGLGRAGVPQFCRLLGEIDAKETRKVLVEALAETAREAPELLLPSLADERWYLVRNTIYILRRIGSPEATGAVVRCVGHRDPRVRKEVLLYFDEVADPAGDAVAIRLLEDPVPALRIAAMRSLTRRRSRTGAERIRSLVEQAAFAGRDLEERQAAWESLAELDPARALPALREMLLRRRLFGAARELDDVVCAAAALRRLGSPEALALLREAAGQKRGKPLEIVEEALRAAARAGGRPHG